MRAALDEEKVEHSCAISKDYHYTCSQAFRLNYARLTFRVPRKHPRSRITNPVGYLIHQSKLRLQDKLLHVHVAGDTVHIVCTDQEAADETGAFIAQRIKHLTSPQMKVKLYLTDIGLVAPPCPGARQRK